MKEYEVVYSAKSGFQKKALDEVPTSVNEGEVIIRPFRVGVCGSDLHNMNQYQGDELRLGHEWVGEIILTSNNSKFTVGDYVSSTALLGCGTCEACSNDESNQCISPTVLGSEKLGMIRSWVGLPEHNLIKLPKLSLEACALLEVAAVGDEAVNQLKAMTKEKGKLLILGAGPVGVMTALSAKKQGYDYDIIEIESGRVKLGKDMGLNIFSLGQMLLDKSNEKVYNLVIDCSGDNSGKPGGFKYLPFFCAKQAKIVLVGKYSSKQELNVEHFSNITAQMHWMRGMKTSSYEETVKFWKDDIESITSNLITHSFSTDQTDEAFQAALEGKTSLKVLIEI